MRVARIVLVVLVVLGGLFVAADRITVSVAEKRAAQRAAVTEGLSSDPKVSIQGFPFLTQVLAGKLDDVKVTADGIDAADGSQSLRIDTFHADLHGVKLSSGYTRAIADSADGNAFITYADLTRAVPAGISVSYAGRQPDGRTMVKLTGSFVGVRLSVLSEVTVRGTDGIELHAQALPKGITALGLEHRIRQQIDVTRGLSHLPANIKLTSVTAAPDGISVAAAGLDVILAN